MLFLVTEKSDLGLQDTLGISLSDAQLGCNSDKSQVIVSSEGRIVEIEKSGYPPGPESRIDT